MLITLLQKSSDHIEYSVENDYTLWSINVNISQKDYYALVEKYQNDWYSVRGTKEEILSEAAELI